MQPIKGLHKHKNTDDFVTLETKNQICEFKRFKFHCIITHFVCVHAKYQHVELHLNVFVVIGNV